MMERRKIRHVDGNRVGWGVGGGGALSEGAVSLPSMPRARSWVRLKLKGLYFDICRSFQLRSGFLGRRLSSLPGKYMAGCCAAGWGEEAVGSPVVTAMPKQEKKPPRNELKGKPPVRTQ